MTATVAVDAGTFEITNATALGSSVVGNAADVSINSGGAFYYNGAAGTVSNDLTLNGGTLSAGTANQTYSGAIDFASMTTSTINMRNNNSATLTDTQRNITLSGVVSGSGGLIVDSNSTAAAGNQINGNLTFNNNANTWSGPLTVLRGSVITTQENSLTTGDIRVEAGKIEWQGPNAATRTVGNAITIAKTGGLAVGELQVNNSSTASSPFTVNYTGAITLGGAGAGELGELRLFLADAANSVANFTGAAAFTLANNAAIHVRDNQTLAVATIDRVISEAGGARSLTVNGPVAGGTAWGGTNPGVLVLNGANTYTGGTSLAAGTLRLGNKAALGTGDLTINGAGTLQAGIDLTGANAIANNVAMNNALTVSGANSMTINGTFTGTGPNNARTLTNSLDAGKLLTLGGTVQLAPTSGNTAARAWTIAGTGDTTITGQIVNGSAHANGITKDGAGTLLLTNANTYTGTTTINGGVLRISNATALGGGTGATTIGGGANAGRLELTGGISVAEAINLSGRNSTAVDAPHISNFSGNNTITSVLTATTGGSDYNVESAAGTLTLAGGLTGGATTGSRSVKLSGAGNTLVSGAIVNGTASVVVSKLGAGNLELSAANSYSGGTIISGGVLTASNPTALGTGSVILGSGAALSVGGASSMQLDVGGPLTNNGGSIQMGIFSNTGAISPTLSDADSIRFTGADSLVKLGAITLLNPNGLNSNIFNVGHQFQLVDWGLIGAGNRDLTDLAFDTSAFSGVVFDVNLLDYSNFQSTGYITVVPEPSRAVLILVGVLGLVVRRRRTA